MIGDRRTEGIELLKLTAEKGSYSSLPAISAYAWILIDEGEFEEAITISVELLHSYPEARSFHWLLGKALKNSEQWEKAAEVYSKLLELVRNGERNNHFNEIGCLHSLALCYENLADYENVLSTTEDALELQLTKSVKKRKSKDLKNLKSIRKHALECLEER